jgi:hypothetical protein
MLATRSSLNLFRTRVSGKQMAVVRSSCLVIVIPILVHSRGKTSACGVVCVKELLDIQLMDLGGGGGGTEIWLWPQQ